MRMVNCCHKLNSFSLGGRRLKKKHWIMLMLVSVVLLLSGCSEFKEPISSESEGFWNEYIVWPLVSFIKFFAEMFEGNEANYAFAIIIVTIIIRLVILPLTVKQVKSSKKMQEIQPKLKELQQKYSSKDAATQQKYQQEMMQLMSTSGVNPLAGCLPALLQIPIFYALFRFFPNLIELRGVPFLFAEDLTAFDSLIILPEWVPVLNGHLSIFAMLYIVAMMAYFKVSGSMDNFQMPQQEGMPNMEFMKYMMYIMPLFFFAFLNNYASGLYWYYLVSNTINIGIVLYIKKVMINETKIHQIISCKQVSSQRKLRCFKIAQKTVEPLNGIKNQVSYDYFYVIIQT